MRGHWASRSRKNVAFALPLLVVVAALVAAACGGASTKASTSPSVAPSQVAASPSAEPSQSAIPLPTPTVAGAIAFERVVEQGVNSDICVINSDGTGFRVLDGGPNWAEHPSWSPDGRRIAYVVYPGGSVDIDDATLWVMNADGSGKRQLTKGAVRGDWPTWSPDGKQIAFSFVRAQPEGFDLFVINADGSGLRSVASSPGGWREYPAWAPNGKILFLRNSDVFAINPDGSGLERLTKMGSINEFALSPDGKRIAIDDMYSHRLAVIPLHGSEASVTLLDPVSDFIPDTHAAAAWTPDGQALAVASGDYSRGTLSLGGSKGSRLYIVNADGSGLSAVPNAGMAIDPAWRPR
jgi:Tol biopolymer transport system component